MKAMFTAGQNLAMKVPLHEFEATVKFYRDILGFKEIENATQGSANSIIFEFGDKQLWIDCCSQLSQAEMWLEITTDNVVQAKEYLAARQCTFCDKIEALPDNFQGFWVSSPCNIIHLVAEQS